MSGTPARTPIRNALLEVLLPLAAFIALTLILAAHHDMWRDEVRAFSVAINADSWASLARDLRREGHPIVWYVVLRAGHALTGSQLVLPGAALAIGWAAAFLLLRYAPFPLWLRLPLIFGVPLAVELTVVARNYGLGVFFLLGAAASFRSRGSRPILPGLLLALAANTSVHAALAAGVLLAVWLGDALDQRRRSHIVRAPSVAGVAIAAIGIAVGLAMARPSADMVYAFSLSQLDASDVARSLLADPGWALRGAAGANITASGEIPWSRIGLSADVIARVLVNVVVISIAWALRRNRQVLAGLVLAVVGFEILFRNVYSGALRHEAVLAFLMVALAWIAAAESSGEHAGRTRRSIALALLPLALTQAAALPFSAWRQIRKSEGAAPFFAAGIRANPAYRDAILLGEPDYFMESMPWYVPNRVYMPRQREFHHRVYFDRGVRRRSTMSLGELTALADSLGCAHRVPVLMAIGHRDLFTADSGTAFPMYRGTVFTWTAAERAALGERARPWSFFPGTTGDENYLILEFETRPSAACGAPTGGTMRSP